MTGFDYSIVQLLVFSLGGIAFFALCSLVGFALYNISLGHPLRNLFINALAGIFTLISIYSAAHTGFRTVHILFLPLLLYLFLKNPHKFSLRGFQIKSLLPLLYIFPLVFVIYGSFSLPVSIENDVRYYAKIASALPLFKQENLFHFYNAYDESFHGAMPYHYTELWLSALFGFLLKTKSILAIKYITYPFLLSAISLGVLSFVRKSGILLLLVFLGLSAIPLYKVSVLGTGCPVYTDFWIRPNFLMYGVMILALILVTDEKRYDLLFIVAAFAAGTSVIIIPSLLGGLFLFSCVLYRNKELDKKQLLRLNVFFFAFLTAMFLFYTVFAPEINLMSGQPILKTLKESLSIWKAILFAMAAMFAECGALLFLTFLLNKFLLQQASVNKIILLVAGMAFTGILVFQALNQLDNSYQFPYFAYAAAGLLLVLCMTALLSRLNPLALQLPLSLAVIVLCFYTMRASLDFRNLGVSLESRNLLRSGVSANWTDELRAYFLQHPNAKGGFVLSNRDLADYSPKARHCLTLQMGSFLCYITNNCNLPDLTHRDTLLADLNGDNAREFTKAVSWMNAFPDFTAAPAAEEYLDTGKLDYFICTKNRKITDSAFRVISDPNSRYIFVSKD